MTGAFVVQQMDWQAKRTEIETIENLCSSKTEQ